MRKIAFVVAVSTLAMALAGCGVKGPLYFPAQSTNQQDQQSINQ